MKHAENIRLSELQKVIRDKLYESFPGYYWIIAEISEIKVNTSGHCYLELTDSEEGSERVTARVRATVWANRFTIVSALFTSVTGITLQPGITILFKATVEYHELYGLSLNITDIDPKYTAGELALKKEAVIRRLTSEGIIDMNKSLEVPLYPRKIAVVSSANAAGYQDFIRHLSGNAYGYVFETCLFDTVMQGEQTEGSVTASLNRIAASSDNFDAVVIIRGGGSQTDLAWFDNYNIAYLITQFPLPVITGIGHDKDMTVADLVAFRALKTPTAVADYFITQTLSAETAVNELTARLSAGTNNAIGRQRDRLSRHMQNIAFATSSSLRSKSEAVRYLSGKLSNASAMMLKLSSERIKTFEKELNHLNPLNVLKRGYTITTKDGIILKSHKHLGPGDKIVTHFEKGTAESDVTVVKGRE